MIKTLTIGNVELPNRYVLAPMGGVTDLPFRLLCKEQGAGLLCMEMISAKALQYKNKNTKALLAIDPREYPVSLQLFGEDPDIISEHRRLRRSQKKQVQRRSQYTEGPENSITPEMQTGRLSVR